MNDFPVIKFTPMLSFIIVAGLVVLGMLLGGKNKHRAGMNWWIGLAVLLLITSGFVGMYSYRQSGMTEERQSVRRFVSDFKDDIRSGIDSAKEALQEGMQELQQATDSAKGAFASTRNTRKNSGKTIKVTTNAPSVPKAPRTPFDFTVSLTEKERSTKQEIVDAKLKSKAIDYIQRWIDERMPCRNYIAIRLDSQMLEKEGAFAEKIDYEKEPITNPTTGETEQLLGGVLKVNLSPALQETLLDMGYESLQSQLQSDQLLKQFIVFATIMGITLLMGLLGSARWLFFRAG